jgi:hypothetical protein
MMSFAADPQPLPEMLRIAVRDPGAPARSRTFDVVADAPIGMLREATELTLPGLAVGTQEDALPVEALFTRRTPSYLLYDEDGYPSGEYPIEDGRCGECGSCGAVATRLPGSDVPVSLQGRRPARLWEPMIRVHDERVEKAVPALDPLWMDGPVPFRAAHVQHELERAFGYVLPPVDRAGLPFAGALAPRSALRRLLREADPSARLALRVHLDDEGLLEACPWTDADVADVLAGLRALAARVLVADGLAQGDDGWFAAPFLHELEQTLQWESPGAGATLVELARRLKLVRRLRGRILGTARARDLASAAIPEALAELLAPRWPAPTDAQVLALLVVADGAATRLEDVPELTLRALRRVRGLQPGDEAAVLQASAGVQTVLAPAGGIGAYGEVAAGVRFIARQALFSPAPSSVDDEPHRWGHPYAPF